MAPYVDARLRAMTDGNPPCHTAAAASIGAGTPTTSGAPVDDAPMANILPNVCLFLLL